MKKPKRNTVTDTTPDHPPPLATTAVTATEEQPAAHSWPPSLEHIRSNSLRAQADVRVDATRTITELEAWRTEIDATIAFLKAQRR